MSVTSNRKDLTLIKEGGNQDSDWGEERCMIFPKVVIGGQLGRRGSRASRYHCLIFFFPKGFAKSIIFYLFRKLNYISQVRVLPLLEPMWISPIHNTFC